MKPIAAGKKQGIYYTPVHVVDTIVEQTIGTVLADRTVEQFWAHPLRILEPSCGNGVFLVRAYEYLLNWLQCQSGQPELSYQARRQILLSCLFGVDIDAQAIAVTRQTLAQLAHPPHGAEIELHQALSQTIRWGNAVIGPDFVGECLPPEELLHWPTAFPQALETGGFDLVIGNPPFLDAELMAEHWPDQRRYCTTHYRTASGNWDLFCVFIEKAIDLCRSGGLVSLVVPNKLGSAQYAVIARTLLAQENTLLSIQDYSTTHLFPASVYPIVFVAQKQQPSREARVRYERITQTRSGEVRQVNWLAYDRHFADNRYPWPIFTDSSPSVSLPSALLARLQTEFPTLAQVATVYGAATVAEAYRLQPLIEEAPDELATAFRLVNSGTLDRYQMQWGQKPLRYLGTRYLRPILSETSLQHLSPKRQAQARQPKIIVSGMGRVLECAVDSQGQILAGKSTSIVCSELDLHYLLAILNSQLISLIYRNYFGGDRLQGGYLRIGPPQLRTLPIAIPDRAKPEGEQLYQDLITLSQRMTSLKQQPETKSLRLQINQLNEHIEHWVLKLYRLTTLDLSGLPALESVPEPRS